MYHFPVLEKVHAFIREQALMKPGDRVAAAVSGGADSVCLLRVLLELRGELGIVLAVAHYDHGIRGPASDADAQFVAALAQQYGLEFHCEKGHAPAFAEAERLSLETAARRLRYRFFSQLLSEETATRIATAHTLDDQAETVLMKFLRGAGTRGLAGIFPVHQEPGLRRGAIVRPLLGIRRAEVEEYLRALGQTWRDDATNLDLAHARNRIRHELLPLLERDFNPALPRVLADTAELARAEEEHWAAETSRLLPTVFAAVPKPRDAETAGNLDLEALARQSRATARRLVRAAAESLGLRLDFHHVEAVLRLAFPAARAAGKALDLPDGRAVRRSAKELRLERLPGPLAPLASADYEYRLTVPGEVRIAQLRSLLRASLQPVNGAESGYNRPQFLDPRSLAPELVVRNWRPGDCFWPAHTKSSKKVKTLLQEKQVARSERATWPVVLSGDTIVWMRGFTPPAQFLAGRTSSNGVLIEELGLP